MDGCMRESSTIVAQSSAESWIGHKVTSQVSRHCQKATAHIKYIPACLLFSPLAQAW